MEDLREEVKGHEAERTQTVDDKSREDSSWRQGICAIMYTGSGT